MGSLRVLSYSCTCVPSRPNPCTPSAASETLGWALTSAHHRSLRQGGGSVGANRAGSDTGPASRRPLALPPWPCSTLPCRGPMGPAEACASGAGLGRAYPFLGRAEPRPRRLRQRYWPVGACAHALRLLAACHASHAAPSQPSHRIREEEGGELAEGLLAKDAVEERVGHDDARGAAVEDARYPAHAPRHPRVHHWCVARANSQR